MKIQTVLVIDDERLMRDFLTETIQRNKMKVIAVENGKKALQTLKTTNVDLVITDMKLPDITGLDILRAIQKLPQAPLTIVITAFGTIENAVEAMKLGAFHYLIKPFSVDTLETLLTKAQEQAGLIEENRYLRGEVLHKQMPQGTMVAQSPVMRKLVEEALVAASSSASILITGESGTGKEVMAHLIHNHSPRAHRPFIRVNCAAVPETLIESEFFGHEKGSFTGANQRRAGRFELADGGSLLLDEITEVPLNLQAKLLRVIQEQEFERVGGTLPIRVDVRMISTSNRRLSEAIAANVLREDLYYRLNVIPIHLPPLRERKEDILPIADHFLRYFCAENHIELLKLSAEAKKALTNYNWPGNVRELGNCIERAVVLHHGPTIQIDELFLGNLRSARSADASLPSLPIGMTLDEMERQFIIETLRAEKENCKTAAAQLGISEKRLRDKLERYMHKSKGSKA